MNTRAKVRALQTAARIQGIPWRGYAVPFAFYGSEDYAIFHPNARDGASQYLAATSALERALKESGAFLRYVPIRAARLREWLADRPNTAALRREFIRLCLEGGV